MQLSSLSCWRNKLGPQPAERHPCSPQSQQKSVAVMVQGLHVARARPLCGVQGGPLSHSPLPCRAAFARVRRRFTKGISTGVPEML